MPAPIALNQSDLIRSITKDSFEDFVREFWDTIIAEDLKWNWHMSVLCNELQEVAERVIAGKPKEHDLVINIPPGTTKSTICSRMYPAWVWTRMSSAKFICASHSHPLALDFSRHSRDIIISPKYRDAFGIDLREDQNTKGHFTNTDKGARLAIGTGAKVTGFHGHFIIIDDPLDPGEAMSEAELKAVNTWMRETIPTRKVDKQTTPTILIMQRLHQNDPSARLVERDTTRHICIPCDDQWEVKPKRLRRFYRRNGGLLDAERMPRDVLDQALTDLGEYGFAGQFGQSPVPLSGGMFKIERISIDTPPKSLRQVVRYWDKAGTKDGGAHTAGVKMGVDLNGRYWVLDVVRGQWDSFTREQIILQTAKMDGTGVLIAVEQEPGSGGKESAENTVRNLAGFRVRVDRPTGDKAVRADPYSTQVNGENVSCANAVWTSAYIEELRYFPAGRFKDQVDASSGAFAHLVRKRIKVGALG